MSIVAIDYEQLRAERIRVATQNRESDWSLREKALVDRDRAELAAQREAEQHQAELAAAAKYFTAKAAAASKAGDPDDTALWTRAAQTLADGKWPIHRRIASSPDVVAHQACRTRLLYQGLTAQIKD